LARGFGIGDGWGGLSSHHRIVKHHLANALCQRKNERVVVNERFANTVVYLLRGSPNAGLTKLLKLLYFTDFMHYRDHLATVTGMTYVAMPRGPVIKHYEKELKALVDAEVVSVRKVRVVGKPKPKQEYRASGLPSPDAFKADEIATLDEVLLRYGKKTGAQLSDMSHEELGPWKLVWDPKAPGAEIPHTLFRWLDNYADSRDVEVAKKRMLSATKKRAVA
jgi:uncharacterized phage-associated protein